MNLMGDPRTSRALHWALICFAVGAGAVAVVSGVGSAYAQHYTNKIYPGVFIGPISVGGLTHKEAALLLSTKTNALLEEGLTVSIEGHSARIALLPSAIDNPDAAAPLVSWDVDATVREALETGRRDPLFINLWSPFVSRLSTPTVRFAPSVDRERLDQLIREAFSVYDTPPVDAAFTAEHLPEGWRVETTTDTPGTVMETGILLAEFEKNLAQELSLFPLELVVIESEAEISTEEAAVFKEEVRQALEAAPYTLTSTTTAETKSWVITAEQLATGFEIWAPPVTPEPLLGISEELTATIFDLIAAEVNRSAQDARFAVENGRVVEFQGNENGIELDVVETRGQLVQAFGVQGMNLEIIVDETKPSVTIGTINELGITEILGVGTSNFTGSPRNRVSNIQNGARLLNGILIAPDQTFSLLEALKPFTLDNGYLAELVIKGDKIQPEVGGGLCQIGTTTFRTAMLSGLPIVERRNHSLVVSYYNDPQNGNPGTDATIYDPSPDFKFLNDTGHYILFATNVDTETSTLTFTFWGTSDGRTGSYSAPEVTSWIGAGATRFIETTSLAPGVQSCQHAYVGANTSFTYTVVQTNGATDEEIFTSSYRALPQICLVGVEKLTAEVEDESKELKVEE